MFKFKKFKVYNDAKEFCRFVENVSDKAIKDKNLCDQINRALNPVVLNIAVDSADDSDNEFARFLSLSTRSVYEVIAGFDLASYYGMLDNNTV